MTKKVLIISHVNDRLASGGSVYTNSIIRLLNIQGYECSIEYVFESSISFKKFRLVRSLIYALTGMGIAKLLYFFSINFIDRVKERIHLTKPDYIFIDHLEMAQYVKYLPREIKCVYVAHNFESDLYGARIKKSNLLKFFFHKDVDNYRQFEVEILKAVDKVLFISAFDRACLNKLVFLKNKSLVLPPTFNYQVCTSRHLNENLITLGFVGNFDWWPNRCAANWFIEEVYTKVFKEGSFLRLFLIGKGSESYTNVEMRVEGLGFLPDIGSVWQAADIYINPITEGSGINIKVAEAIYNYRPLICTSLALRGLELSLDAAILTLDSPEEWIKTLKNILFLREFMARKTLHDNASLFASNKQSEKITGFLEG